MLVIRTGGLLCFSAIGVLSLLRCGLFINNKCDLLILGDGVYY